MGGIERGEGGRSEGAKILICNISFVAGFDSLLRERGGWRRQNDTNLFLQLLVFINNRL